MKKKGRKTYYEEKKEKLEQLAGKYEGLAPEIYGIRNSMGEELIFNESITITSGIDQWLLLLEQ